MPQNKLENHINTRLFVKNQSSGEKLVPFELYTDYLISNNGYATATGLSTMLDGEVSHDQVTRFLSERDYTSKDLWQEVKSTVRQLERETGFLIFDDTIQEKA